MAELDMPRFVCCLLTVADMGRSRRFYEGLLGQRVAADYGQNVSFAGGFSLHERSHFQGLLDGEAVVPGRNDGELYFESDDIVAAVARLENAGAELVQPLREQPWRQLGARFRDPDGHLVELGEPLPVLVRRLAGAGLAAPAISAATGLADDFVKTALGASPKEDPS